MKDKYGFPCTTCRRCGGTGKHSFNPVDGDRCYGCQGSGRVYANGKVANAVKAMREALRAIQRPMVGNLKVGDQVLDRSRPTSDGKFEWSRIVALTRTDKAVGWSYNRATGKYDIPWAWNIELVLETGEQVTWPSNMEARRRMPDDFDVTPYLRMAGIRK